MTDARDWDLPRLKGSNTFERMCLDLFTAYKRPIVESGLYGRNGQKQHGVDFFLQLQNGLHAYQCKGAKTMSVAVITSELKKLSGLQTPIQTYTILTNADADAPLELEVHKINALRIKDNLCPVAVKFWPDIRALVTQYHEILTTYYPSISPGLVQQFRAAQNRLSREYPLLSISMSSSAEELNITIEGPSPAEFGVPIGGRNSERLKRVTTHGEEARFSSREFSFTVPHAIAAAVGIRSSASNFGTLTVTPTLLDATLPIRLVVGPLSAGNGLERFTRRAKRSTEGHRGTLRMERPGTEVRHMSITFERLALQGKSKEILAAGTHNRSQLDFYAHYAGATVHSVLAAEEVINLMQRGCYIALLAIGQEKDTPVWVWEQPRLANIPDSGLETPLAVMSKLADLTDWDLRVPVNMHADELQKAASLCRFFDDGERTIGMIKFEISAQTADAVRELRRTFFDWAIHPTMTAQCAPYEYELFGQKFAMPAREVTSTSMSMAPEDLQRLNEANNEFIATVHSSPDAKVTERLIRTNSS